MCGLIVFRVNNIVIRSKLLSASLCTQGTKQEWQTVFFIAAGMYAIGAIVFAVFVEGTVLPWADNDITTKSSVSTKQNTIESGKKSRSAAIVPVTMESVPNGTIARPPATDNETEPVAT